MSISYGTRLTEAGRQVDAYAGRTLKGAKPADLPVVRLSKFELAMNAETARMGPSRHFAAAQQQDRFRSEDGVIGRQLVDS
jgi:hypothetical protein